MGFSIVGILNFTPDSFSGDESGKGNGLSRTRHLFDLGAELVDIGAEATNPFTKPISSNLEIERLNALNFREIVKNYPSKISLDTYHPETFEWALGFGYEFILNDVSGLYNPKMLELAIKNNVKCIIGHISEQAEGVPINSHKIKQISSIKQVVDELNNRITMLRSKGLKKEQIIVDPCIGFGKTPKLNWGLLGVAKYFPDYPVMIGYSKKRFLGTNMRTGQELTNPDIRFSSTRNKYAATIAINSGASYLRVHDIKTLKRLK